MKQQLFVMTALLALTLSGCTALRAPGTLTQHSTIDALLAGIYDGDMTCRELMRHGDTGIGTFDRLDGEMILLNGRMHQIKADGKVYIPDGDLPTPFATVTHFQPDIVVPLQKFMSYANLKGFLDDLVTNQNLFCAIVINGRFSEVKTRSVPAQSKPYPPLAAVTPTQPEFRRTALSGTLVGFRCPPYAKGINVPGYHLHFLSDAGDFGGHVLDLDIVSGTARIQFCRRFLLLLPRSDAGLAGVDLSKDRSAELEKVER